MSDELLIEAWDLGLAYQVAHHHASTVKEYLVRLTERQIEYERKWGLRHATFGLREGEVLGVVGPNGAGKSTLMKLIARVLTPTEGRIVVRGRVAPLIELGAGFHPDLTGQENILLYGMILGHEPKRLRAMSRDIAEWAGVVDELDVPVRAYSSGMSARLAFSVATALVPDILVVDEALSVGDEAFREQSTRRIERMIAEGTAVVLVSHELDLVRARCSRAIWIQEGRIEMMGETDAVVDAYLDASAGLARR